MKKLFLILFVIGIANKIQALNIQNITISSSNISDINVRTKVGDGYTFYYYNNSYEILNNTISLNICYNAGFNPSYTSIENDFIIPNINLSNSNYTLIVNVKQRQYLGNNLWTCDSTIGFDTETITFSTPVTNAISLGNTTFENSQEKISLFPNPATNSFQIKSSALSSVTFYDNLGRLAKEFLKPQITYDISDLNSGVYYVRIKDINNQVFEQKLIKK